MPFIVLSIIDDDDHDDDYDSDSDNEEGREEEFQGKCPSASHRFANHLYTNKNAFIALPLLLLLLSPTLMRAVASS